MAVCTSEMVKAKRLAASRGNKNAEGMDGHKDIKTNTTTTTATTTTATATNFAGSKILPL